LSSSRYLLLELLVASHSMVPGTELRQGLKTLERFHSLNGCFPLLRDIKLHAVDVVSPLGDIIPVPTIFCSTWRDFDYVIQVHCRDHQGCDFIARGDYEIIRAEDFQIIQPSEFASAVQSGVKLEMSIVMWQKTADERKCPRCGHINFPPTAINGWIECRRCLGHFLITAANQDNLRTESNVQGDENCGGPTNDDGAIHHFRRIHVIYGGSVP